MPIDYMIDEGARLIRVKQEGPFTIAELIEHSLRVNADPRFSPGMNTLSDLRKAVLADRVEAINDYVNHAAILQQVRGACKWACLVEDETALGLIKMFDLVAGDRGVSIRTRAFLSEEDALAWLTEKSS